MNLESILNYFTHHVEAIIQWLFLAFLALTGFVMTRSLLGKKRDDGADAAAGLSVDSGVETVLQKILERTSKLDSASIQPMSPEAVALVETQVATLKKELSARDEEIKALKASGGASPGLSEEAAKLAARLKELEAKLAEYEILEDDIADLSLYKEENVRLRKEVEGLRGGAPVSAPAPAAAPAAELAAAPAVAADAGAPDDIVAEFADAVAQGAAPEAAIPETPPLIKVPDTGNPMNDFEAAVKMEKKLTQTAAPTPAPTPAPVTAAPTAAAAPASASTESDDLFAELAEPPKAEVAEGDLDTEKMMAEMAALVSLDPASGNALEEGIDTDKMAAEAGAFTKR